MMTRAEFERLLDVYGFRCERFGQDLSTHARAQVLSAFAALASAPVAGEALAMELRGVAETIKEGDGFWRSCSGCHELNEGRDTGPYSAVFQCHLGNGCSECGGIGAIWDSTDYQAMADAIARDMGQSVSAAPQASPVAGEACAWFTEDHLTDKSATTWDRTIAERWRAKGWPVQSLFAAPQASAYGHTPEPLDTSPGHSAPQAPAGWRWTLHPAGLHPDVYAAAAAHASDEARNAALEEAASLLDGKWATWLVDRAASEIRKLKSTPAPTAVEGGQASEAVPLLARALAEWHEDDGPVTWWAWCGHEWAGEAPWCGTPLDQDWPGYHTHWTPIQVVPAALSAQPGAIRNPLIAEPSGNSGELERAASGDVALPPCPQALVKVEGMPRFMWPEMQDYARAAVLADRRQHHVNTTGSDVDIDRQQRARDEPCEDDMLTIAYLAGAQAEKERAALADRQQRDGDVVEVCPECDIAGCQHIRARAALAARKEGDGNA